MTPLEKAARALCIADGDKPDRDFTSGNVTFPCWKSYQSRVRAVLQALREPSDDMEDAGKSELGQRGCNPLWGDAGSCYKAMIDAALSE